MTVEVRVVPMSGHEFLSLALMATICCYHGYHLPYSPINGYTVNGLPYILISH